MTERKVASEDEPGEKWDRCIADAIVKTGTGFGLGLAFSLLLFKRRPWPVALGSGFGLGYASSNCQHDFRRLPSVYLRPVKYWSDMTTHEGHYGGNMYGNVSNMTEKYIH
ncbi:MICOS complex subunit Mic10-like isoform X2 [Halichondria panicea]|uniref:MICOS complex subunit Mic10-like isoform X2 n=1 Tax=Halichondria panicea TaxID=6063 RepID=UPI00312B79FE